MALHFFNQTPRQGVENVTNKLMSAKTFGAAKDQSTVKKKALLDVGNTLHKKLGASEAKAKTDTTKKDLMKVYGDKENAGINQVHVKQEKQITYLCEATEGLNLKNDNAEPVCHCFEKPQDDFIDIMVNNIRLTKPEIEHLALVWENPSILTGEDVRDICKEFEPMNESDLGLDHVTFRSSLEFEFGTIEDLGIDQVPLPFFDPMDSDYEDSADSGIDF